MSQSRLVLFAYVLYICLQHNKRKSTMFKFFLNDSDDRCLDTFIDEDGDFGLGMKLGDNMGYDLDDGTPYLKTGDGFGMDI